MTIPRFNAQIQALNIPSLVNYQEQQNASIAKSLNDFGASLLKISAKIAMNKQDKDSEYYKLKRRGSEISSSDEVGNG